MGLIYFREWIVNVSRGGLILSCPSGMLFKPADITQAEEQRDRAKDAEAGVDTTPVERNATNGPGDEGERDNARAGDESEMQDPFIADGVDQRSDKSDGDDQMPEGQPVSSVGHERIVAVGDGDAFVNAAQPGLESGFTAGGRRWSYVEDAVEHSRFALKRECGETAQHKADDEECHPDADAEQQRGSRGIGHWESHSEYMSQSGSSGCRADYRDRYNPEQRGQVSFLILRAR